MRLCLTSWSSAKRFWRKLTTPARFMLALWFGIVLHTVSVQLVQLCLLKSSSNSLQTIATEWFEKFSNQLEPALSELEGAIPSLNQINQDEQIAQGQRPVDKVDFRRPKFYTDEIHARQRLLFVRAVDQPSFSPTQLYSLFPVGEKKLLAQLLPNQTLLLQDASHWPVKVLARQQLHNKDHFLSLLTQLLSSYREPYATTEQRSLLEEYEFVLILIGQTTQINAIALERFLSDTRSSPSLATHFVAHGLKRDLNEKHTIIEWMQTHGMLVSNELFLNCATNLAKNGQHTKKVDAVSVNLFSCLLENGLNINLPSIDLGNDSDGKLLQASKTVFQLNLNNKTLYWQLQKVFLQMRSQILIKQLVDYRNRLHRFQRQHFRPTFPVDIEPAQASPTRFDVIPFQMFNETHAFYPNDLQNSRPLHDFERHLQKRTRQACLHELRKVERIDPSLQLHAEWLHTYRHSESQTGEKVFLDFVYRLDDAGGVNSSHMEDDNFQLWRCRSVRQLHQTPLLLQNVKSPAPTTVAAHEPISVVTVVSDSTDAKNLIQFLKRFRKFALDQSGAPISSVIQDDGQPLQCRLWILFQYADEDDQWSVNPSAWSDPYQEAKVLALRLHARHHREGVWIRFLNLRILSGRTRVLGQLACADVLLTRFADQLRNSLLFFTGPASILNGRLLHKVLQVARKGIRAYAMIPFFEYRLRSRSKMTVGSYASSSKLAGHFLATDVQHLVVFHQDLVRLRSRSDLVAPLLHTSSENDRKIDIRCHESEGLSSCNAHLLQLFSSQEGQQLFELLRAPEPLLRVLYSGHSNCERLGSRAEQSHCVAYTSRGLGTKTQLASLLLSETQRIHNLVVPPSD